jgi:hypothetical protein
MTVVQLNPTRSTSGGDGISARAHTLDASSVAAHLGTDVEQGLSSSDAAYRKMSRVLRHGEREIRE